MTPVLALAVNIELSSPGLGLQGNHSLLILASIKKEHDILWWYCSVRSNINSFIA